MEIVFGILLGICMIHDLKTQKIPAVWIWLCIIVMAVYRGYLIIGSRSSVYEIIYSIIPGLAMVLLSHVSKQIGNGDGMLIVACGFFLGWRKLLAVLMLAFLITALFAIGYVLIKRRVENVKIPFIPFLFVAIGVVFIGVGL